MTNRLFRDYLDGKIHVRKRVGPGTYLVPAGTSIVMDDVMGWVEISPVIIMDDTPRFQRRYMDELVTATNPHEQAMRTKRNTSTGPQQSASWRGRGRVTKYKEG